MRRRDFLKFGALAAGFALLREWPVRAATAPFPVYLTFDDGPTTFRDRTGPTTNVLDTLKAEQIPATFFLHGRAINRWEGPVIVRMLAEGHAVGNHLWQQGGNTTKENPTLPYMARQY